MLHNYTTKLENCFKYPITHWCVTRCERDSDVNDSLGKRPPTTYIYKLLYHSARVTHICVVEDLNLLTFLCM